MPSRCMAAQENILLSCSTQASRNLPACFGTPPLGRGSPGDTDQLPHAEHLNNRGSGEIREAILCVLGQMQKVTNLNSSQRLVLLQTPLLVEDSPDRMPVSPGVLQGGLFWRPAL